MLARPPAPGPTSALTTYEDPDGLFSVSTPASWTMERGEGWASGLVNTYTRTTMLAPADAHLASVDGYLSEGVRITFHHPPDGQEWTMATVDEWAPSYVDRRLELNPGFALTSTSSLTLGGQPAIEYQMVGESPQIPEPEKAFFVLVANERYRMVMEIVSPTSKLGYFNELRPVLLESFRLHR